MRAAVWPSALACACGLAALAGLAGCTSVSGSAIRTGPVHMPAYSGPVEIRPTGQPPPGAVDLGVVEVHASQQEATVDTLLPQFVRKVAQIGGNVAVVDGIRAQFEFVGRMHVETFYYTCGMGATCAGTRVYSLNDEVLTVRMFGRAFSTHAIPSPDAPLIPAEPAPAPPSPEPPAADPSSPEAAPSAPSPAPAGGT